MIKTNECAWELCMWAEGGVFDTISFYWYGTFTLLVLICKKEKKKAKE